jgi:aminoglycoside phosphotransferase family enzyme
VADRGELTPAHLDAIIDRLAPFYEQAASGPHINRFGQPGLIAFNHEENFRSTEALAGVFMEPEAFQAIRTYARNFLATQRPLFRRRIRDGRIRDCHGDLHMRNICLADGVHIFDCIEFNARFRYGDVAADIDFLAMELDFHGFQDLSRYFVSRFAQASRDPELLQALNFYKCYRAYVRGKVQALAAQDEAASPQARDRAGAAARAYFALAGQYARQADV